MRRTAIYLFNQNYSKGGTFFLLFFLLSSSVIANTYTPNTTNDYAIPLTGSPYGVNNATGAITSGPNAGAVTLRSAIIAANRNAGADIINLSAGATYTLSQGPYDDDFNFGGAVEEKGDLDIFTDLTINGNGAIVQAGTVKSTNGTDGNGIDRVFEIANFINDPQPGYAVTFNNFTVRYGKAPRTPSPDNYETPGGGVMYDGKDAGTLTLNDMTITDNYAAGQGGGVTSISGNLHITGTTQVTNNICGYQSAGGLSVNGGNSYFGNFQMTGGTITGNKCNLSGGGILIAGVNSGFMTNTSITNNTALATTGNGGGGVALINGTNFTFTNITITGNHSNRDGGGLWLNPITAPPASAAGTVTINGGTVSNNTADFDNNGSGDGGGVYILLGTITIGSTSGVAISGNTANNGGGIYTGWNGNNSYPSPTLNVTNSAITGNNAKNNGGGLDIEPGAATTKGAIGLSSVTLQSNKANSDNTGTGDGGAVYNNGVAVTISSNSPIGSAGSGNTARNGGGIANISGSLTYTGVAPNGGTLVGNTATVSGGGLWVSGGTVNLSNLTVTNNTATTSGGAFYVSGGTLTANLNRIVSNTAPTGSGIAQTAGTASVENNWWGCDGFPVAAGCQTGSGTYDADPRIDLILSSSVSTICIPGTATLTADVTKNTNGVATNGGNAPMVLVGQSLIFGGTLLGGGINAPLTVAIPTNGIVTKTYTTASTPGTASPSVTLDNGTQAVNITLNIVPSVTTNPSTQSICVGNTVTFTVAASGTPAPAVQWQVSTNGGSTFSNIAGATSTTYSFATAQSDDQKQFRAVFTNSCGTATTSAATLTVNPLPTCSLTGANAVCAGTTGTTFTGTAGMTTYAWSIAGNGTISGAANAQTVFVNAGAAGSYTLTLTITNANGCSSTCTKTVTVNALPAVSITGTNAVCASTTGTVFSGTAGHSTYGWSITGSGTIQGANNGQTVSVNATNAGSYTLTLSVTDANTCSNSTTKTVTVTALSNTLSGTPGGAKVCATYAVAGAGTTYSDASCNPIAKVVPSGAAPVAGNVTTCVKIDNAVQTFGGSPYVQRHYDVLPATNPSTATATVTLFFTQTEFTAYNAARGSLPPLPLTTADAEGYKANLIVSEFHGTSSDGTLNPSTYSGAKNIITPTSVTYNGSYWEVTITVNGFSGFFAHTGAGVLPLTLLEFNGCNQDGINSLKWTTAQEVNTSHFIIQRSLSGASFMDVATVSATGNNTSTQHYTYDDQITLVASAVFYYRLKMVDRDGRFTYSPVIKLSTKISFNIEVMPNPFEDKIFVKIEMEKSSSGVLIVSDVAGRILQKKNLTLQKGTTLIQVNDLTGYASGLYSLRIETDNGSKTIKLIKR